MDNMDQTTLGFVQKLKNGLLGSHYLYLVHDREGRVVDILNPENSRYSLIVRELRELGNLAGFYDFSSLPGPGQTRALMQKSSFKWHPTIFELFTSLPQTSLITQVFEQDLYLSRMSVMEFGPNISSQSMVTLLFVDMRHDRLAGFTPDLHRIFRDTFASPENMINLPLSALLSPTPSEFQKSMVPDISEEKTARFFPFFEKNFLTEPLGPLEETPVGGEFDKQEAGLFWKNSGAPYSFITLLKEFNTEKNDFVMELVFQSLEGKGPYFVLGGRYISEDHLPDNAGYFAGRSADTPDRIVFKRNGFSVCEAGDPGMPGEITIRLFKIGESLILYQDETRLLSYYDSDCVNTPAAFLSLGLRQGYACLLKKLIVRLRPIEARERPQRHRIKLKTTPDRFYTLDRFYNQTLNIGAFSHVSGFFMNDITDMQEKIAALDHQHRLQIKNEEKLKSLLRKYQKAEDFIGSGSAMTVIRETARTVAQSSATVLIEGPTGSGKEVLARFIHENSDRREGPFIKVDCSTIPQNLIESHLFGHEKGAFTGALARNIGMLEKADMGTLFLDEAGNLTAEAQAKLLQFLNDFTITRIGGAEALQLNVRCIVASNTRLEERVKAGLFREDLYYRINVVYLRLPNLKDRLEDIPALSRCFLSRFNAETGKRIAGFSPQAVTKLSKHAWPGNIRELKNVIHRAVIFCQDDHIPADLLTFSSQEPQEGKGVKTKVRSPFYLSLTQKAHVLEILKKNFGHVTQSARELSVARGTLYKFLKAEKIIVRDFRKGLGGR